MKTFQKFILCISLLLAGNTTNANMASPYIEGTVTGSALSSKYVDVLHENIYIHIDEHFHTAKYIIEYTIKSDTTGKQIPLLFYAADYKDEFRVWLDNAPMEVFDIPFDTTPAIDSLLLDFSQHLEPGSDQLRGGLMITWDKHGRQFCFLRELKYFEPELSQTTHKIRVEYIAVPHENLTDWIKKYSFHYSLSPARNWKSFGTLNITVEQAGIVKEYSSNLGTPHEGRVEQINTWHFDSLPDNEFIELTYKPQPGFWAQIFITVGPMGLALILGGILVFFHLKACRKFRRHHPQKKYSWVLIAGNIAIPYVVLFFFAMNTTSIINCIIGDDASGRPGFMFFYLFLYPFIAPLYWLIMWLFDKHLKRKELKKLAK